VAGEYERQLTIAAGLAMLARRLDFKQLELEVSRGPGQLSDTLDVIFPDWTRSARDGLERSLRHRILEKAPAADPRLT
jgi:hypothetical protein